MNVFAFASCIGPAGPAGKDGTNGTNGINGTNGTNGTNGQTPGFRFTTSQTSYAVASGNSITVDVGGQSGAPAAFSSSDGISWTASASTFSQTVTASAYLCAVAFGGGVFVAIDTVGNCYVSDSTGSVWTYKASILGSTSWAICYGNGDFVAVGYNDDIRYSADGQTWQESNITSGSNHLYGVAYGAKGFVAVGTDSDYVGGYILLSADGTSWASQVNSAPAPLNAVCYGNGHYVAAGNSTSSYPAENAILTSVDAVSWTVVSVPVSAAFNAAAYGDGVYVVAGGSGTILTSIDSTSWSDQSVNGSTAPEFTGAVSFGTTGPIFVLSVYGNQG